MQVMKDNKTFGKVPFSCFYASYKGNHGDKYIFFTSTFIVFLYFVVHIAYRNHTAEGSAELSVNKGDNFGIIDFNREDGYWMVNYSISI